MRLLPGLIFIAIPSAFAQFMVDTVAGGKIFSGVPAQSALLTVSGVTQDSAGNIYVCDGAWSVIRRIRPNGIIETIAGTGITGYSGDGGPAVNAAFALVPLSSKYQPVGNVLEVPVVGSVLKS